MDKEIMDSVLKKVAAINDISCLGGASITQIIPILSAMGIKTYPVPTVILSTHSGGYANHTYQDLTGHMSKQKDHWKSLSIKFDCIYSGFLGSARQIAIVEDFIDSFRKDDSLIVIDPVMGDNGTIYSSIDENIINDMKNLVAKADIITPNLTEAFLLAGENYIANPSGADIKNIIYKIKELGTKNIIITSCPYENKLANVVLCDDNIDYLLEEKIDAYFPGTGDIFASVLIGCVLNGIGLTEATEISSNFVRQAIDFSIKQNYSHRSGVLLEAMLPKLYKYNKFL